MKIYTKTNFHKHTFCIFKEVETAAIEGLKINYASKSGSSYIFTEKGVYRKSNHWGRAANCKWRIVTIHQNVSRTKIGFAEWSHFHPINDVEKLYYIEVDFDKKIVQYNHKNNSDIPNLYLRNASETTKRVKEIRSLFLNEKKLDYWEIDLEITELLQLVTRYLINTDLNMLQIKEIIR